MKLEEYSKLQLIYAVYDALTYIPYEMMFGCTGQKGEVQEYFFDRIRSILEILNIDPSPIKDMNFDNFDCSYFNKRIHQLVDELKRKYPDEIKLIYSNHALFEELMEIDLTGTYGEGEDLS